MILLEALVVFIVSDLSLSTDSDFVIKEVKGSVIDESVQPANSKFNNKKRTDIYLIIPTTFVTIQF